VASSAAEPLRGGNTTPGVMRVGDTVRRPRGRRSEFAGRALRQLHGLGFPWAPAYLGVDDYGCDMFEYVDGATTDHPSQRDERCYAAIGAILRRLHDDTRGHPIAAGGDCLVHGDPGPFNVVMREGMPRALIDWDSVHAGDPREDIGYAGWTWCVQSAGNVPVEDQARRLAQFRDGYDRTIREDELITMVIECQDRIIELESANAADDAMSDARRQHAITAVAWAKSDRRVVSANLELFRTALRRAV